MLKHIKIAAAFLLMAVGCSDLNDIKDRLDSAESRLEALETQVDILKGNLETLTKLKEYHTIKAVEFDETEKIYEITLTNGEKISLYQGSIGFYSPIMTIDEEGYWKMSLTSADGTVIEEKHILNNGEKVSAVGEKGITPQFRIDSSENWEVSYDEGTTWTDVLNEAGQPVKATPNDSADNYFEDVTIEDGKLVIKMKDQANSVISLPILGNFYFIIKDEIGNDINDLQFFTLGETKKYTIDQSDISEVTVLTCPAGFSVNISGDLLEITAVTETRSLSADSGRDITFLATSASNPGLFVMEKLQVEKTTAPIVILSKTDASIVSLTFGVKTYNSDGYYYVIRPAHEPEPTSAEIRAGAYSTETELTVNGLIPATEYVLYVMSTAGEDTFSNIVKLQTETSAITSYYDAYQAGLDIEIAGVKINKSGLNNSQGKLITSSDSAISETGVYFIEQGTTTASIDGNSNPGYADLIIIGDSPSSRATLTINGTVVFSGKLKNLDIIEKRVQEEEGFDVFKPIANSSIIFDNCHISTATAKSQLFYGNVTIKEFVMHNCDIEVTANEKQLWKLGTNGTFQKFDLTNNIIYSSVNGGSRLFEICQSGSINNLIFNYNTVAEVYNSTQKSYVKISSLGDIQLNNNLFYLSMYSDSNYNGNSYTSIINTTTEPTSGKVADNVMYWTPEENIVRLKITNKLDEKIGTNTCSTQKDNSKLVDTSTLNVQSGIIKPNNKYGATR